MAKNTFRTPPQEEKTNKKRTVQSSLNDDIDVSNKRHPIVQLVISYCIKFLIYFFSISLVWVLVLKFVPIWVTPTMIDRKVTAIFEGRDSEIHSDWEPPMYSALI
eukprot:Opistho-2@35847